MYGLKMNHNHKLKNICTFLQKDTDEEVKEHIRNNLHLQEKVIIIKKSVLKMQVWDSTFKHENCDCLL